MACGVAIGDGEDSLCGPCWDRTARVVGGSYCSTCGEGNSPYLLIDGRCGLCLQNKPGRLRFSRFVRVGRYEGPLRRLILRFKHRCVLEKLLGEMLADVIQVRIGPEEVDIWAPVPSPWRRRMRRGFQPTALLAERVARRCGGDLWQVLAMKKYVPPLHAAMSASERAEEMRDAFKLRPGVIVRGRTVCLIDDVTATGATLSEARRVLRAAGVKRILAAVLAKTSRTSEPPVESPVVTAE